MEKCIIDHSDWKTLNEIYEKKNTSTKKVGGHARNKGTCVVFQCLYDAINSISKYRDGKKNLISTIFRILILSIYNI